MKNIGFIGVGIMGKGMVRNLMKHGFSVSIYARNKSKAGDLIAEGAAFCDSIGACAAGRDAVITIVGFPQDVEQVYMGEGGLFETASPGTILIDMTTSSPKLAQTLYKEASSRGLRMLDAPVTGGDTGAKNGTLSILVGGDKADYDMCLPLFEAMGQNIHHEGPAGFGQHTKLANQIMIAGALSGVCEALTYAQKQGLDMRTMLDSVSSGAAGSKQLEMMAPKILDHDFAPGFFIKHFIKDMRLAQSEAQACGLTLDILNSVLSHYEALQREGYADLGTQALIKYYQAE